MKHISRFNLTIDTSHWKRSPAALYSTIVPIVKRNINLRRLPNLDHRTWEYKSCDHSIRYIADKKVVRFKQGQKRRNHERGEERGEKRERVHLGECALYRERERKREREREGLKQVGLLTFFSTESVDIDFVHPEYDVTGLDLQKQQTPFLWKRILQKDQLVRYDELPCTARRASTCSTSFWQFDDTIRRSPLANRPTGRIANRHYANVPPYYYISVLLYSSSLYTFCDDTILRAFIVFEFLIVTGVNLVHVDN